MNTKDRKKAVNTALGAAIAAVAAPAMLCLGAGAGAGAAHANPAENNELRAWWDVIPGGLHAHVQNKTGQASRCHYSSRAPYSIPFAIGFFTDLYVNDFDLPPRGTADWVIGGIPTNTTWETTINCPGVGSLFYRGAY